DVPLPGATRRRPHHPRRPTTTATHRRHMAVGPSDRHRLEPYPHRLHLNREPPDPTRRKTPQALESPPTQRHGQLVIPTGDNPHHKPADTGSVHPGQPVRKIEASAERVLSRRYSPGPASVPVRVSAAGHIRAGHS